MPKGGNYPPINLIWVFRRVYNVRKLTGMEKVTEHIEILHTSGFVKDAEALSSMIIAHPERGKTTELMIVKSDGMLLFNDLTTYGLLMEIKDLRENDLEAFHKLHHLVIPDLERISSRSKTVKQEIVANLQIMMQEGLSKVRTKFMDVDMPNKILGVIMATTPEDLGDKRSIFRRMSFMSRLIPYSYNYDGKMRKNVLEYIKSELNLSTKNERWIKTTEVKDVKLPNKFKDKINEYSEDMKKSIEEYTVKYHKTVSKLTIAGKDEYKTTYTRSDEDLIGGRALDQLMIYAKSIALNDGKYEVNEEHMNILKEQQEHFNFDMNPL